MALITLSVLSTAKDASSITLKATPDGAAPAAITLKWRYWTSTTTYTTVLTAPQITSILSAGGLQLTPVQVGLSGTAGSVFADGVHQLTIVATGYPDGDLKVLFNQAAEQCIVSSVGKLAEKDCDCIDAERVLNKLIRYRFAADVQFDLKDYDGAHNLVIAIGKYCGSEDCNC